jgi:Cu+-exporting ATPase
LPNNNQTGKHNDTKQAIKITGMTCASCAQTIETALLKTKGIRNATVNLATETAYVEYNDQVTNEQAVVKSIQDVGYDVVKGTQKIILRIGDMTCASCAQTIENALNNTEGIIEATVNLATEKAMVTYDTEQISYDDIKQAVEDTGYRVLGREDQRATFAEEEARELQVFATAKRYAVISWALTIPIIIWMIPEMVFGISWPTATIFNLAMVILATPVLFYPGWNTYTSAFKSITHRTANMDVLIMLGTLASFLTGPASFLAPIANYGGVGAMIMSFHLTGRYIEAKAKGRASQAIRRLLELEAKTARIIRDGQEIEVPIDEVEIGDIMIVRPGEKIPTDGEVIDGASGVDESMATGRYSHRSNN